MYNENQQNLTVIRWMWIEFLSEIWDKYKFCIIYKWFDQREWIFIFHKTTFEYNSRSKIISFSIHMWYLIGIYDGLWIQEIHSEPATFLLIKGIFEISCCHIQHYWYPSNDAWHVQMHLLILISCPNGVINNLYISSK